MILSVDLGTTNLKTALLDAELEIADSERKRISDDAAPFQEPRRWLTSIGSCLDELNTRNDLSRVRSVAVTSTSGTILPIDREGEPLFDAVMYNFTPDTFDEFRNTREGYFRPTFSLPKIHWMREQYPEIYEDSYKFLNPADFVVGHLTSVYDSTDPSNALKMGYHPRDGWLTGAVERNGLDFEKLPTDVVTDNYIGDVSQSIQQRFGLPPVPVYNAGVDTVVNLVSLNINTPGEWISSLGSSLSIRGITPEYPTCSRFYAYPHPKSGFIAGAHSNLGTRWMIENFTEGEIDEHLEAISDIDDSALSYPRSGGEVLPISDPELSRFTTPPPESEFCEFKAGLKTLLFFEKWIYELITDSGYSVDSVYSTGFLSEYPNISQLRADVLGYEVRVPEDAYLSTSKGAAAIALLREKSIDDLSELISPSYNSFDPGKSEAEHDYAKFKDFFRSGRYETEL